MAAPWTIWCDQTDSVAQRDTGLMQFYCWSNQEILDSLICSFKIAETLSLPCMVCFDGFFISHTYEVVDIPKQEEVDDFLPPRNATVYLDTKNPMTFSGGTLPNNFMEFRYKLQKAFEIAPEVIIEVYNDYRKTFKRDYKDIEAYNVNDADIVLIASGSAASTIFHTVKKLRAMGKKAGLLRIRQLRPLPEQSLISSLRKNVKYAVLDRNLSPGTGGVFTQEIRGALNKHGKNISVYEFIAGLGGRDISEQNVMHIYDMIERDKAKISEINWLDIKGK
jgi:pyruvate/2-oxoacid:ferredoxin oxidoreductase alpha subunit